MHDGRQRGMQTAAHIAAFFDVVKIDEIVGVERMVENSITLAISSENGMLPGMLYNTSLRRMIDNRLRDRQKCLIATYLSAILLVDQFASVIVPMAIGSAILVFAGAAVT
ncbi:unnamed protein product [Acanthocheilonema viteae]|uniref:Uncharacterized protein n=1 Tax=Acanthocheilonema viteae TaxID=6277 RepID=A0A498S8D9_ACAVI|nr:unnamed protein product [Acanthocheilonema viteae]